LREDAVVVDGGDIGTGGRFGLGQEKSRSEEKCCGVGAEDAACGCHSDLPEEYHDGWKDVSLWL
jgi:hypothetical protein